MATAIEYGLIAAGISLAIVAVVNGFPSSPRWDDNLDKKRAAIACAARPTGDTANVVISSWYGSKSEYSCPDWPSIFYPTYVRRY